MIHIMFSWITFYTHSEDASYYSKKTQMRWECSNSSLCLCFAIPGHISILSKAHRKGFKTMLCLISESFAVITPRWKEGKSTKSSTSNWSTESLFVIFHYWAKISHTHYCFLFFCLFHSVWWMPVTTATQPLSIYIYITNISLTNCWDINKNYG